MNEHTDVQANAVGALGNLAMTEEAAHETSMLLRLVPLLATTDYSLARQVARVSHSFSTRLLMKQRLCKFDALRSLVALLRFDDMSILRDTAGILANVVIGESEAKAFVIREKALDPLLSLLKDAQDDVRSQVVRAVFALMSSDESKQMAVKMGALESLVRLASLGVRDMSKHALGALANISTCCAAQVVAVRCFFGGVIRFPK